MVAKAILAVQNGARPKGFQCINFMEKSGKSLYEDINQCRQYSASSRICSIHLTPDCFTKQFSFDDPSNTRRVLLEDSVLSVDIAVVVVASNSSE